MYNDGVAHLRRPSDTKTARREAQAQWRAFLATVAKLEKPTADLAIGIASSFTADALIPMLGGDLVRLGFRPRITLGAYNQIFQTCLDPLGAFRDEQNAIILLWRMEELFENSLRRFVLEGESSALEDAEKELGALADAVKSLRRIFAGSIIVSLPMASRLPYFEPTDLDAPALGNLFHRHIALAWARHMERIDSVRQIDLDSIERLIGTTAAFDARKSYLYRQPVSDAFLYEVAHQLTRILCAERRPMAKCVVLDCDNTLWGGIIGEDGIDGIQLGQDFPGSAYRDFQAFLLSLRRRGVLLALCTKNNETDVQEVFRSHDGMLLRWQDISAHRIDWRAKQETIAEIAAELNIGLDSLVFIDDSAFEIEQIRQTHAEIRCIHLPDDPALLLTEVRSHHFFDKLETTAEDRSRADMMKVEKARAAVASSHSKEDFLRSLELVVSVTTARPEHLGRVAQLINKTNQFNLTTKRRTLGEVRVLSEASDHLIFTVNVRDRFGEYGLVGVVVVNLAEPMVWQIDTFLLSCRVLGRGWSSGILSLIASAAMTAGAQTLRGLFIPTTKNAVAADFYEFQGFHRVTTTVWERPAASVPTAPAHLTLDTVL